MEDVYYVDSRLGTLYTVERAVEMIAVIGSYIELFKTFYLYYMQLHPLCIFDDGLLDHLFPLPLGSWVLVDRFFRK